MEGDSDAIESREIGPPGDLPRVRDKDQGRPYSLAWYPTMNMAGGMPLMGGPVGMAFNALIAIDPARGPVGMLAMPQLHAIHEPVHVPAAAEGHEGWLIVTIDRMNGPDDYSSELWVLDAGDITARPVAKVKLPRRLRPQVHGWWVPAAELTKGRK